MTGRLVAGSLLLALVATPVLASKKDPPAKPSIEDLALDRGEERLGVSFRLVDGLSEELMERIHSGIEVTFNHRIDLLARRAVPLWTPKVVARARIVTAVAYDPLTRQYRMRRETEMRRQGKRDGEPTAEASSTESAEEALAWMTEIEGVPGLYVPPAIPGERLRVRIESSLGRRYVLYLFPARRIVSAERPLEP